MANKIALADASAADETEFRTLLAQVAPRLGRRWEMAPIGDADLVVVDVDSVFGHMTWLKVMNLGKTAAVFSEHAGANDTDLVLRKPLTAQGIIDLIASFHGDATPVVAPAAAPTPAPAPVPAPAAAAPPPRPTPPPPAAVAPRPTPPPAPAPVPAPAATAPAAAEAAPVTAPPRDSSLIDFLTGSALLAPVRLSSEGAPDVILDPKSQSYHCSGTGLRALAPHCTRKLKAEDFQAITSADLDKARIGAPPQPYARLLWFAVLSASRGHLLPELAATARYKLGKWPQIEREFPKHFRIATVMMKQLATLNEIADAAASPLPDVIDFVNAYHAIGFVENDAVRPADPATAEAAKGGMLSRLRNPFAR